MRIWLFIDYNILIIFSDARYQETTCFLMETIAS